MDKIDLIRDVLDKQVLDRDRCKMGRVDGIVITVAGKQQPRVSHLSVGGTAIWHRLHPGFERFAVAIRKHIGPRGNDPYDIPWSKVMTLGKNVKVDLTFEKCPAMRWEEWLKDNIIKKIPGCDAKDKKEEKQ